MLSIKRLLSIGIFASMTAAAASAHADQTIVFLRHGEKPASGLGQLTCQGLNRSLALLLPVLRPGASTNAVDEIRIYPHASPSQRRNNVRHRHVGILH